MICTAASRWLVPIFSVALIACSDEAPPEGGTGGSSSTSGAGGSAVAGSSTIGGGGMNGTAGKGGGLSNGGNGTSGNSTGGSGTSGSSAGGSSGSSGGPGTAGASGSGGGGMTTSSGCGKPTTLKSGDAKIQVDGKTRDYILSMPKNYEQDKPYKLIFGFHWRGANAIDVERNDYYGLRGAAKDTAIFVSPDSFGDGWTNTNGEDINFTLALLNHIKAEACVDESRVFSAGFSYGGMMSFAVGCALGDKFRAIAPFAGALYSGCKDGTTPVAMWGSHGYSNGGDGVVPIADGRKGRDVFLKRNGCGTETKKVEPDECVSYQGCKDGYPVTWCEWNGGHSTPRFATDAVWEFFSQF